MIQTNPNPTPKNEMENSQPIKQRTQEEMRELIREIYEWLTPADIELMWRGIEDETWNDEKQ